MLIVVDEPASFFLLEGAADVPVEAAAEDVRVTPCFKLISNSVSTREVKEGIYGCSTSIPGGRISGLEVSAVAATLEASRLLADESCILAQA